MNRGPWKFAIAFSWLSLPLMALRYWLVWDRLPARMATHFNALNQPNGWMSREVSLLFTLVLFVFMLTLFTVILTRIRKPDATAWALLGMFYVILGFVYWISESVLEYNSTGAPIQLVVPIVTLFAAIFAVMLVAFTHKRGQILPTGAVLAEEVHPGRLWALVFFLPAVIELAVVVAIPNTGLRLALGLAALLIVAAVVGKQACALGGIGTQLDRVAIGLGMIPRGEVGLIFANIGLGLTLHGERIVDERMFSAIIIAVMTTTLVTPPVLKWRLTHVERRSARAMAAGGTLVSAGD